MQHQYTYSFKLLFLNTNYNSNLTHICASNWNTFFSISICQFRTREIMSSGEDITVLTMITLNESKTCPDRIGSGDTEEKHQVVQCTVEMKKQKKLPTHQFPPRQSRQKHYGSHPRDQCRSASLQTWSETWWSWLVLALHSSSPPGNPLWGSYLWNSQSNKDLWLTPSL